MKQIELIGELKTGGEFPPAENIAARQIYKGARRQIMEIELSGGAVLSKHSAGEPITVLCLAGTGKFLAGADLSETQNLKTGTLLTLGAGIEHAVVAEPELRLLVTKFIQD
jgi:quercetin dioxygenase-like cupin family protein